MSDSNLVLVFLSVSLVFICISFDNTPRLMSSPQQAIQNGQWGIGVDWRVYL